MDRRTLRRSGTVLLGLMLAAAVGTATAPAGTADPARGASALLEQRDSQKWYQVKADFGGQPEFLYAIAERFLGDGERWLEIFDLNEGRTQPDGNRLTDPARLIPGWILKMPDDAAGDGIQTGALPTAPAQSPNARVAPTAAEATQVTTPDAPSTSDGGSTALVVSIIVGSMAMAGLGVGAWWFLWRRRSGAKAATLTAGSSSDAAIGKPDGPPVVAPARTFDTAAAWTIHRALQAVATSADAAGRPTPPVYGVSLDESRITLRLAAPDDGPFEPWEATENGRVWQAALRELQALPASNEMPSPHPRLVTLGTAGGVRELIDLGQATGVISLQGDRAATRELIASWTEELSSSPWSGGVEVVAGDIRPHLTGGERVSIRDAINLAEGDGSDASYTLRGGSAGVDRKLGVLILGSTPGNRELERALSLVNRPDGEWVVIVLGKTRYDRWRFTVDADGRLDTGALGLVVYTGGVLANSGRVGGRG